MALISAQRAENLTWESCPGSPKSLVEFAGALKSLYGVSGWGGVLTLGIVLLLVFGSTLPLNYFAIETIGSLLGLFSLQ